VNGERERESMKRNWLARWFLGLLLGLAGVLPALAGTEEIGIVAIHGKWGSPTQDTLKFARAMENAGYSVYSPEMPWSGRRMYDGGVDVMMKDIGDAVEKVRAKGAKKIFLAGHSFGAAGAIRYAGQHKVDGLIVMAPGHFPESKTYGERLGSSVAKAREMLQAGRGEEQGWFGDLNTGNRTKDIQMAVKVYLDFFDPDGPMNFSRNVAAVKPDTPVLWTVGSGEAPGLRQYETRIYESNLPKTPQTKMVEVPGGHRETPDNSVEAALAWLKEVAGQ
jgi:pimeloyl-ACP methyl ester carboxylesterase